jgi:hypothetical protein
MTNYPMPTTPGPRKIVIRQASANFATQSPFTYTTQVLNHPGRRWEIDITLPPMKHATARPWLAWFGQLDGQLNTFTAGDPVAQTPRGSAGGTPLVAGASQTGSTLDVDGCTVSQTGWLLAGDYIQIGTGADARLYMATADVDTDGSGAATIPIWPALVAAPADNAAVIVSNTVGAFRLSSNVRQWSVETLFYGITFSGIGVI